MSKKRAFLFAAAGLAGGGALAAWRWWPESGFLNPCLTGLPRRLATHELVKAAWDGLNPENVWDAHSHLVGQGDSSSGITVNPRMESALHPGDYLRRLFFLNGSCAYRSQGGIDEAYVARLLSLMDAMKRGAKLLLFAFDRAYTEDGRRDLDRTAFHVPDAYARETAREHSRVFEWACSIHPYRADCVEALEQAKKDGARLVKWLPAAMNIDPASPGCDRFYAAAARLGMPITSHAGEERALRGGDQGLGNPLRLRRALDSGVRVIVAHCASAGQDRDLDKGRNGPLVDSFSLFARLMEKKSYEKNLFGDISAMTQVNRAGPALVQVIERAEWHSRLLNGSDYPLPGIMPLFSVEKLVSLGLLPESAAAVLNEIRAYNPLLFDFVLKRSLRAGRTGAAEGKRLSNSIFETRRFFEA